MRASEKTEKIMYDARQNNKELDAAFDELAEILNGVLGALDLAGHVERPLNDTQEHKDINAALDAVQLAFGGVEAVFSCVYG